VHVISDDRAKLPATRIHQLAAYHRPMIFTVVSEVRDTRSGSQVHLVTQNRVADVGKVSDIGMGKDDTILDLHRLTDMTRVTNACIATKVTVRADLAVFTDDNISLNIDSRKDAGSLANIVRFLRSLQTNEHLHEARSHSTTRQTVHWHEGRPRGDG
jgi:hypothetical protein